MATVKGKTTAIGHNSTGAQFGDSAIGFNNTLLGFAGTTVLDLSVDNGAA